MIRRLGTYFVCFLIGFPSYAQVSPPRTSPFGNSGGSDFYVGLDQGKPLIVVNILSGVKAPGVYHIPIGTNVSELISYAGGATPNANLGHIQIRSKIKNEEFRSGIIDLDSLLSKKNSLPALANQDVIYIAQKEGLDNTIKWLTLASLAASIISAIVIINDNDN